MTIAHSARKIIKTQRFIFRALPVLLASVFVLNACAGAVPVTVSNSSDSNEEIAKLKQDATTADNRITELEEASRLAGIAKITADNDITRLKNELLTATNDKNTANLRITTLEGELSTANNDKSTADADVLRLTQELATANSGKSSADADVLRLTQELQTANSGKSSADADVLRLTQELATANSGKSSADADVLRLTQELATANSGKSSADADVLRLTQELQTANSGKSSADADVLRLTQELATANTDKNTANLRIAKLEEQVCLNNPFDALCTPDPVAQVTFCRLGTNEVDRAGDCLPVITSFCAGNPDNPLCRPVEFNDWTRATTVIDSDGTGTLPLLNGAASVGDTNPGNNFVQGLPTLAGQGFDFTGTAFADATVRGDILLLEADSPSGVAFSNVSGTGVTGDKAYAGLLPGTNLGAPITDINTSVIWDAKFAAISVGARGSNPGFKMLVTFDGSTGTINSGTLSGSTFTPGEISVLLTHNGNPGGSVAFNIQGKFGRDGLLYGTVNSTPLTGLIGQNGAVGAFVSTANFAGGFVAKPIPPDANPNIVNYADWTRSPSVLAGDTGILPLLNGAASVGNANPVVNFVQGLATVAGQGFDFAGTGFPDATVLGGVLLLEVGSPSGVAFSNVSGTGVTGDKAYAGLLPGTNLGAPITDITIAAIWDAKFAAISVDSSNVYRYSPTDFKMRVTFDGSAGTINSGTVLGSTFNAGAISVPRTRNDNPIGNITNITIRGQFGSDGLLYGTVSRFVHFEGLVLASLTGLIGQNGAVGAFVSTANFAGGFVAKPIPPDANPNIVNYADWTRSPSVLAGDTGILPLLNGAASVGNANPNVNFIQGLPTKAGQGFDFAGTDFSSATIEGDVLLMAENSPSGVAFSRVYGGDVTGDKVYAGLLPGTNLGAPITDITIAAIWDAKFAAIRVSSGGNVFRYSNPDFKMQVTFDGSAGTINSGTVSGSTFTAGAITVPYTYNGNPIDRNGEWNIQGRFGSDGLLSGTVRGFVHFEGLFLASLTGLIGSGGAVGAFVGYTNPFHFFTFAGGFVAKPPVISPDANPNIVNYADWTRATTVKNVAGIYGLVPLLNGATRVADTNPIGNFVQGLATVDNKGFDFAGTGFSTASVAGDVLLLEADSPSGVAFSRVSGTDVTGDKVYAGLLPTTNLGAPITANNTSAIWDAKFDAIYVSGGNVSRYSNLDSQMRVTFNNSGGTINFGTVSGNTFTPGDISLPYTDGGSGGSNDFNIQGKFGRDGLLYGTVRGRAARATLTGLIGVDGAVGAFVTGNNNFGFAGGFVAHPTNTFENVVVAPPIVDFADWAGAAGNPKLDVINRFGTGTVPLLNGAASVGNSGPRGNFIQGLPTVAGKGFDFTGTDFASNTIEGDVLLLAEDSPSGVAYSVVYDANDYDSKYYAGLLSSTNLGAPITDPSTNAIWDAKFVGVWAFDFFLFRYPPFDFKMQVIFNGSAGEINSGTVSGSTFTAGAISVPYTDSGVSGSDDITIQGKFGSDGLLYGTVELGVRGWPLTGLIGSGGAVGAFATSDGFAGGFVAKPPK